MMRGAAALMPSRSSITDCSPLPTIRSTVTTPPVSPPRTDASSAVIHALRGAWLDVRDQRIGVLPQRALWLPRCGSLVVADLHIGKPETYRALGVAIPDGMLDEMLDRLDRLVEACAARRIVVLGDLVHAPTGMTSAVRGRVAAWLDALRVRDVRMVLVRGNHDHKLDRLPAEWPMDVHDDALDEPPFCFTHVPAAHRDRYVLAGHLHPTFTLADGRGSLRLPCFHFGPRIGVLPAFSTFSRGVPMTVEPGDRAFVIAEGDVVEVAGGV